MEKPSKASESGARVSELGFVQTNLMVMSMIGQRRHEIPTWDDSGGNVRQTLEGE